MSILHSDREPTKQISLRVPISAWRKLRLGAAECGKPITELVWSWVRPHVDELPEPPNLDAQTNERD